MSHSDKNERLAEATCLAIESAIYTLEGISQIDAEAVTKALTARIEAGMIQDYDDTNECRLWQAIKEYWEGL